MIRTLNIVLMVTGVLALTSVYALKYSVEDVASAKAALERSIEGQERTLSMLKADWAYLNQPAHIAPIVARHVDVLGLEPIRQEQFSNFDGLPMRLVAPDTSALDDLFASLEAGIDPADQTIAE